MNQKPISVSRVISYGILLLIFFALISSRLMRIGEQYSVSVFPTIYPIIGGYFVLDWAEWFCGFGFIFGWLPFKLIRTKTDMGSFILSSIITFLGVSALFIVSLTLRDELWRDIVDLALVSTAFGMTINVAEHKIQQNSSP